MLKNVASRRHVVRRWPSRLCRWAGASLLASWLVASLCAQAAAAAGMPAASSPLAAAPIATKSTAFEPLVTPPAADLVREIDDPASGTRWLLFRDPIHPGGPGRLVPVASSSPAPASTAASLGPSPLALGPSPLALGSVIHLGDRIVIEQDTPVIEARFEAVALGPAAAGSTFQARLRIGGRVVRAIALAPHRAALIAETGLRP
jgi:hypothetical protein